MDGVRYGMVGIFVWAGADASARRISPFWYRGCWCLGALAVWSGNLWGFCMVLKYRIGILLLIVLLGRFSPAILLSFVKRVCNVGARGFSQEVRVADTFYQHCDTHVAIA
jgi:hypothetical protein